jgi:hypothetical protein
MIRLARQRAKAKGIKFRIGVDDIFIPKNCPVLGIPIARCVGSYTCSPNSPSLDRFIPSKGYVPGNVNVISRKANRIKNNATVSEIEKLLRWMRVQEKRAKR